MVVSVVAMVWLDVLYPPLPVMIPTTDMYEVHVDFDTFWQSAVSLVHGGDIYITPAKLTNLNPPLLTVLLVPFAWLDALTAYRIWVVLCLVMVFGSLLAVARELRLRPLPTGLALAAVLASSPLHGTLVLGQIYPCCWSGWLRAGSPSVADVPCSRPCCSGSPWPSSPRSPRCCSFSSRSGGGGRCGRGWPRRWSPRWQVWRSAGPSERAGLAAHRLQLAGDPDTVDNASLPGLAVRLGVLPVFGLVAGPIVLGGTLLVLARHRDRVDPAGTVVWSVLAAGLLLSPIAWHNYLMLLFPGALLLIAFGRGATATRCSRWR